MCPVIDFLSHALADGVFLDCDSFDDIIKRRPVSGSQKYRFRIKQDMYKKPLLCALQNDGTISPDKILSYSCLHNLIRGIGERAGYAQRLRPYCFRRGYGNAINSK
jgi:hypothetical protein